MLECEDGDEEELREGGRILMGDVDEGMVGGRDNG